MSWQQLVSMSPGPQQIQRTIQETGKLHALCISLANRGEFLKCFLCADTSCGVSSNKGNSQLEQNPQDLLNNNVALPRDANSTDKNKTTVEYHEENGANQEHKQDNILSSELAPLFIPVVVTVEKGDHKVLASQWCPDSQNKIEFGEVFNKLRYLNDYLRNTSAREVIVASLDISCLATTLDQLHDHFLKCVEESMISKE